MATKNIVPNTDNDGSIGVSNKRWAAGHFQTLTVGGQAVTGGGTPSNVTATFTSTDGPGVLVATNAVKTDSNIALTVDVQTKYNTNIADNVRSIAIGSVGAQTAQTWKNKNLVEVLDDILFPLVNPTYQVPTASISSGSQGALYEVGSTQSVTITAEGTQNDAGAFTTAAFYRNTVLQTGGSAAISAGTATPLLDEFGYGNPNNPNDKFGFNITKSDTATSQAAVTWNAILTYLAGNPKKNSRNTNDPATPAVKQINAPQDGSTILTSDVVYRFVYPYFWGVSASSITAADVPALITAIGANSPNRVVAYSRSTIVINFGVPSSQQRFLWFAVPATGFNPQGTVAILPNKTSWYVNESNQGLIGTTNDLFNAPSTLAVTSTAPSWSGVNYKIYVTNYATSSDVNMQIRE
jgi:hypothetical protein